MGIPDFQKLDKWEDTIGMSLIRIGIFMWIGNQRWQSIFGVSF